jgi:hypothetical protein
VIITVRSETKGQEAISTLRADPAVKAANPSAEIEAFQLDLSDYQSAFGFCKKVKEEVTELDILLCNAGLNIVKYEESKSGHEMVMQGSLQDKSSRQCQLEAVANVPENSKLLHKFLHCRRTPPTSPSHSIQARNPIPTNIRRLEYAYDVQTFHLGRRSSSNISIIAKDIMA